MSHEIPTYPWVRCYSDRQCVGYGFLDAPWNICCQRGYCYKCPARLCCTFYCRRAR
ncbi:hypothetical protein GBAR_LOCUS1579, partial [Geodia barretti]